MVDGKALDHGRITRFGSLAITEHPALAFWQGSLLADLTPAEVRLLKVLARTGKAGHFDLYMTSPNSKNPNIIKVQMVKLRRRLPRGLSIKSVHGWGYELINEEEDDMTTTDQEPAEQPAATTIRDLAVAAAQNIGESDKAAVLVVIQGDGQARVTPVRTGPLDAVQVLGFGCVLLAKAVQAKPDRGVRDAPIEEAA